MFKFAVWLLQVDAIYLWLQGPVAALPVCYRTTPERPVFQALADVDNPGNYDHPDSNVHGPRWGPPGSSWPQMGLMLPLRTLSCHQGRNELGWVQGSFTFQLIASQRGLRNIPHCATYEDVFCTIFPEIHSAPFTNGHTVIQSGAVITRSCITRYFLHHYSDWNIMSGRFWTLQLHPISSLSGCILWGCGRQWTAFQRYRTVLGHRQMKTSTILLVC